jgi:hypothetical protein
MQARLLGVVAVKIWGVLLVARAGLGIVMALVQILQATHGQAPLAVVLPVGLGNLFFFAVTVVVALLVFRYADPVMAKLLPEADIALSITVTELQNIAFGVLGLYLLAEGSLQLVSVVFQLVTGRIFASPETAYLWQNNIEKLVEAAAEVLLGIGIATGRNGLAVLWARLRGREPVTPSQA